MSEPVDRMIASTAQTAASDARSDQRQRRSRHKTSKTSPHRVDKASVVMAGAACVAVTILNLSGANPILPRVAGLTPAQEVRGQERLMELGEDWVESYRSEHGELPESLVPELEEGPWNFSRVDETSYELTLNSSAGFGIRTLGGGGVIGGLE